MRSRFLVDVVEHSFVFTEEICRLSYRLTRPQDAEN
jgi:hypothetical protein